MSFRVRVIASVACAVLAVVLVAAYASSVRSEASAQREGALRRYGGETAQVCVATQDIARGETFSERNVETMEWLVDLLPEGALADEGQLIGKTASSAIAANTPLADVDVDDDGAALDVPADLTALSVPCSSESAVGGALAPGSEVDVYMVSDGAARLVCQRAEVLATSASGTSASLSWVTLAVDPSIVEALVAASSLQKLYFVLPGEDALSAIAAGGGDAVADGQASAGEGVGDDADVGDGVSAGTESEGVQVDVAVDDRGDEAAVTAEAAEAGADGQATDAA